MYCHFFRKYDFIGHLAYRHIKSKVLTYNNIISVFSKNLYVC